MFKCFGRDCKKSPSPSPKKPNLPANMLRHIAQSASPRTRRAMSRATTPYTRRTMPLGLQVTKVGAPTVSVVRPPVVNRSRATAKTPKITRGSVVEIDRTIPQAYKNNTWKYYYRPMQHLFLFLNTPKGVPYTFNKHGKRINAQVPDHIGDWRGHLRLRRKIHTWDAYQKRLMNFRGLKGSTLPRVLASIDAKVQRFIHGDRHALDDVPYSQLILWANMNRRMSSNGRPYVKNASNGKWYRYGSGQPLTKNMILNNINLSYEG